MWRRTLALVVAMAALVATSAASPIWPDRLEITLTPPPSVPTLTGPAQTDFMPCVVDADGRGRCHHRDGLIATMATAPGAASCAGAEGRLRPACTGPGACVLTGVGVPTDAFGLLVLEVRPPAFGVPRHAVAQAAVVAPRPDLLSALARERITGALGAAARCLAPADAARVGTEVPVLGLGACTTRVCDLERLSLRFASRGRVPMAGQ